MVILVTAVNLFFLLIKAPSYQKKMDRFDDLQNSCRNVNWMAAKQMACVSLVTDTSSRYVDQIRSNAVYGLFLPIIFFGAIFLYKDLLGKPA